MSKLKRNVLIIVGIIVGVGFLYLVNLVIYKAVILAFGLTETSQLLLLGIGLGFLSISFIVSTIIGSWFYNAFTRAYYTFSAIWVGILVYLFFASSIYGIVVVISKSFIRIGPVLFFVALLLSVYGIFHARKIVITKTSVSLPNLPPSWKGRKAVWISDLHLGQMHGLKFAQGIVARVSTLSPDIIFIGGDLYDGTGAPDIHELITPFKTLSVPLGVHFVTGNHEEYGDRKRFISAVESAGIHVLKDEMIEIDGLQLVGVDYKNASDTVRFKEILSKLSMDRGKVSILLKHEPKDLNIAHEAGISFQISGHTHNGQLWPFSYIAQLIYKGFTYGLNRFKDMPVYTSSGTGTWGPPMRVGLNSEIALFTFNDHA